MAAQDAHARTNVTTSTETHQAHSTQHSSTWSTEASVGHVKVLCTDAFISFSIFIFIFMFILMSMCYVHVHIHVHIHVHAHAHAHVCVLSSQGGRVLVYMVSTGSPSGETFWCPDCAQAEPHVQAALAQLKKPTTLVRGLIAREG